MVLRSAIFLALLAIAVTAHAHAEIFFPKVFTPSELTDTEGMQAFWLNYNDDLTSLDGAEADGYDTIGGDQVIPLVLADRIECDQSQFRETASHHPSIWDEW